MAVPVAGEQYYGIDGQLHEIKRQLRQPNGYPFDPAQLQEFLQRAVEGRFQNGAAKTPAKKSRPKFKLAADGTVTFTVTSDGTTGDEWIARLQAAGHKVGAYAKQILWSPDFVSTKGVSTKIVVMPGKLWTDDNRLTRNIRAEASKRKLVAPNAEVACLIRMMFSNADIISMGLRWLIAMHEPIKDSGGDPRLLGTGDVGGDSWLNANWDNPDRQWSVRIGFAFAVSQLISFHALPIWGVFVFLIVQAIRRASGQFHQIWQI